jgi:hypothetical protein
LNNSGTWKSEETLGSLADGADAVDEFQEFEVSSGGSFTSVEHGLLGASIGN